MQTLLIVDDEPVNIAVLVELLKPFYRVKGANSGEAGLSVARQPVPPDLILLDVVMPDMGGHEVMKALQADPQTRESPVIFVTSLNGETDEEYGLQLGAMDYLTKPIKPRVVLARVQTQLELKQARDQIKNQNQWLEAEVQRRIQDNLLIQDLTLMAMAELAETRDTDTGYHIQRIQIYVELLGRELRPFPEYTAELGETELLRIVKASPLHDIGKIGIPDQILLKPGRLTPEEFEIMKTHSQLGSQAIEQAITRTLQKHDLGGAKPESLAFLEAARDIALNHHEKWDGSGYPGGLAGKDIPLSARLMAVADVFDALTMRRVYKQAWEHSEAVKYIRDQAGSHFDPEVVKAFLAVESRFREVAQHFMYQLPDK